MSNLEIFQKPFGVKNYLNTCVEFFNPPLPMKSSETDEEFYDAFDLFQQSSREGNFEPVFIPPEGDITICNLDTDSFELIPDTDQIVSLSLLREDEEKQKVHHSGYQVRQGLH